MKKICCLGLGAWGYCLASLLASKSNQVICWTTNPELASLLTQTKEHPKLAGHISTGNLSFTTNMAEALDGAEIIVEAVTSAGLRPVLEQARALGMPTCPIVVTSKGIEQDTLEILPEVAVEVLGEDYRHQIGCLSGPSFAQEVIRGLPTSVVASGYAPGIIHVICETFMTPVFRVYPNSDIKGVSFGGALKNIIAIACGISDGLGLGASSKAALMTRGLHEIRKLAVAANCKPDTINGLSGMGDLCLTCNSSISRNFKFGLLLAQGIQTKECLKTIDMVVEGSYTVVSALQLAKRLNVELPISEIVNQIIYHGLPPQDAVKLLMKRSIKEEHL